MVSGGFKSEQYSRLIGLLREINFQKCQALNTSKGQLSRKK